MVSFQQRILSRLLGICFLLSGCSLQAQPAGNPSLPAGQAQPLVVEEHPICRVDEDTPDHFEFNQRISADVFDLRKAWRNPSDEDYLKEPNQILAPFGYELRSLAGGYTRMFQLFKGDMLLVDQITFFWQPTVRQDGTDFALFLENDHGRRMLVNLQGVEVQKDVYAVQSQPIYAGNNLVYAVDGIDQVTIWQGQTVIFSTKIDSPNPTSTSLKNFTAWDGKWVLEVPDEVFVNGESLNQQLGYPKIYNWQLIAGEPFFFFEQNGRVQISYAGEVLPGYAYDEVIHYRCCEPAAFNPAGSANMAWFYAQRGGQWQYVEAGIYGE